MYLYVKVSILPLSTIFLLDIGTVPYGIFGISFYYQTCCTIMKYLYIILFSCRYSTAVQVLPGDEIVTTCKYKSLSRPRTTFLVMPPATKCASASLLTIQPVKCIHHHVRHGEIFLFVNIGKVTTKDVISMHS